MHRELTVAGCLSGDKDYDVLLGMDALADCSLLLQYGGFVLGYPDGVASPGSPGKELA